MTEKLVITEMVKPRWIKDLGTYNILPSPHREVNQQKFLEHLAQEKINFIEFRQIPDPRRMEQLPKVLGRTISYIINCRIFYFHKVAYAEFYFYDENQYTPFYYEIGCEHQWKELSPKECREKKIFHGGACFHVSECQVCGTISSVDSSG